MQDRPTANELAQALQAFLQEEVLKEVRDSRLKYRLHVAMTALGILGREGELEEALVQQEMDALRQLFGLEQKPAHLTETRRQVRSLNMALSIRIRSGTAPASSFEHLWQVTRNKLSIANPKQLEKYGE
jgi:hypothetical protein